MKNLETALRLFEAVGKITLITKQGKNIDFTYSYDNYYAVQLWIDMLKVKLVKVGSMTIAVR